MSDPEEAMVESGLVSMPFALPFAFSFACSINGRNITSNAEHAPQAGSH